jgi:hypothetical protein
MVWGRGEPIFGVDIFNIGSTKKRAPRKNCQPARR